MRSFRARPVGWRQESYRHMLAARGVSTTKYLARKRRRRSAEEVYGKPEHLKTVMSEKAEYRPKSRGGARRSVQVPWQTKFQQPEVLRGGKGDGYPDSAFNKKWLRIGIRTEREHTRSTRVAKEIAKDHLVEDPMYYYRLLRYVERKPRNFYRRG